MSKARIELRQLGSSATAADGWPQGNEDELHSLVTCSCGSIGRQQNEKILISGSCEPSAVSTYWSRRLTVPHLLVVEDQKKLAASLKKGLEQEGYLVTTVATGEEAYYAATTGHFDALVLD